MIKYYAVSLWCFFYFTSFLLAQRSDKNEVLISVNKHLPYKLSPIINNASDLFSFGIEYNRVLLQNTKKNLISIGTGVYYRNYGYKATQQYVPYINIPVNTHISLFRIFRFYFYLRNSFEFGVPLPKYYQFPDPNYPAYLKYQLFLHKNYSFIYIGGLSIKKNIGKHFFISVTGNINIQLDEFDTPYNKNIGAITNGTEIGFTF